MFRNHFTAMKLTKTMKKKWKIPGFGKAVGKQ